MRQIVSARRLFRAALPVALALCCVLADGGGPATAAGKLSVAFTLADPRITESSGLAASRTHEGVYWTHNDSEDGPYVYAVDSRGNTVATVTLRGVAPRDLEGIAVGPDGDVYVGDIGDNLGGSWPEVWIYRFREPERLGDATVDATRYTVRYDDGPRDAEALMVHPVTGRVHIASKSEDDGGLYAGPQELSAGGVNTFRRIAPVDWITDGAFSPDGTRLVLRGYFSATAYRWADGAPEEIGKLRVPLQRQGESVAFTADGRALLYGSEGAGSDVWRLPLSGEELPESAAAGESAEPSGKNSDAPATDQDPGAGAGAGAEDGEGQESPRVTVGALALAAVVLLFAGRRLFRRTG